MASKVTVTFTDGTTDVTTGVTAVAVETAPARLVITYTETVNGIAVSKSKVWNWDQVRGYQTEPDA